MRYIFGLETDSAAMIKGSTVWKVCVMTKVDSVARNNDEAGDFGIESPGC